MTVNIWKSCMWTADKEINMKAIFAVMNTSWAVVKIRPEKKKNSGLYSIWVQISYRPEKIQALFSLLLR